MSEPPSTLSSAPLSAPAAAWSPVRWATMSALFAVALGGGVLALTRWPTLPSPEPPVAPRFQLVSGQRGPLTAGDLLVVDPTQFALNDPHGFSGSAARALSRGDYEVAELTEPPTWLAIDPAGKRAGQAPPLAAPPRRRRAEVLPSVAGEAAAPALLATTSQVALRGGLAGRKLAEPLKLPVWSAPEVLPVTVVEVGVDPGGEVWLARLMVPSGSKPADEAAVALARTARFTALDGARRESSLGAVDLAWGELVFQWRTRPPD